MKEISNDRSFFCNNTDGNMGRRFSGITPMKKNQNALSFKHQSPAPVAIHHYPVPQTQTIISAAKCSSHFHFSTPSNDSKTGQDGEHCLRNELVTLCAGARSVDLSVINYGSGVPEKKIVRSTNVSVRRKTGKDCRKLDGKRNRSGFPN